MSSESSHISSTTLRVWRERPPTSYSVKVQNFSKFKNLTLSSDRKYQSRRFSSGDYNWRMIIHPSGNKKDNGSGFISMYVEIDTSSLVSETSPEVFANVQFFIFNKKENKYFTIQDVEPKLFNTPKMKWGFSQVLPLKTFSGRQNGYIFDGDHCEFGVDVIVAPPPTNWEMLSFVKPTDPYKFSWSIKNFFDIKENSFASNTFSMGERKWVIELYPKGFSTQDEKWLSIFMYLADGEVLKVDEKLYIEGALILEDPRRSRRSKLKFTWFYVESSSRSSGWDEYMSIEKLRKTSLDKEFRILVEFKVVSSTQYSPIV